MTITSWYNIKLICDSSVLFDPLSYNWIASFIIQKGVLLSLHHLNEYAFGHVVWWWWWKWCFSSLPSIHLSCSFISFSTTTTSRYIVVVYPEKHSVNGSYMYYAFKGQERKDLFVICGTTQQRWAKMYRT